MRAGGNKPGLLTLTIKDKSALYLAYMPFVKNGGLFIPTNSNYRLGDEVFMLLNLNPIMSIIANVPAAVASTVRISIPIILVLYSWLLHENLQQIVACRVVRRLNNFAYTGPDLYPYPCVSIGKYTVPY